MQTCDYNVYIELIVSWLVGVVNACLKVGLGLLTAYEELEPRDLDIEHSR